MNQLLRKYRSALAYLSLVVISLAALLSATNIVRGFTNPTKQPPNGQPTAIPVGVGGTGSATAEGARTDLGVAASGANNDITSLSPTGGILSIDNLKTNGALQLLATSTAPVACGASSKANLYFNSTDKKVYYCDGSAWKSL